jgi:hypothetical protein
MLVACATTRPLADKADKADKATASAKAPPSDTVKKARVHSEPPLARSVVSLIAHRRGFDWTAPWALQKPTTSHLTGVVVAGQRILVTGAALGDLTLLEAQKFARPKRYTAQVQLVDYEIPLALVSVADPEFWTGLEPLPIAEELPEEGGVSIHRWLSSGQLEDASGRLRRLIVATHWPGRAHVLSMEISATIENGGWSEVVANKSGVLGLTTGMAQARLTAIAAPVLRAFLEGATSADYRGVARGGYSAESITNPALRKYLGLSEEEGGILIRRVLPHGSAAGVLEPGDVLLEIGGFKLDGIGEIEHPRYGRMSSTMLYTDGRRPGDTLGMKVLRGGKHLALEATLRRMLPEEDRIPAYSFDRPPEYQVVGGLILEDLARPYLETFREWSKHGPLRLLIAYDTEAEYPEAAHPRRVVLTRVLADPVNLGYQDLSALIVESVNGVPVRNVADVRAALDKPENGFHVIRFLPGQGTQRIVLDAAEVKEADARIRSQYGIDPAH